MSDSQVADESGVTRGKVLALLDELNRHTEAMRKALEELQEAVVEDERRTMGSDTRATLDALDNLDETIAGERSQQEERS